MKKPQITIVVSYLVIGFLWIFTTDILLLDVKNLTLSELTSIQTIKGNFFIIVSGLLIYLMLFKSYKKFYKLRSEYNQLFLNNPHPMWIYDVETLSFLKVNKAAITNYGYSEKEFLEMTIKDIRPTEDLERLTDRIKTLTNDLSLAGIWQHKRKNGHLVTVKITTHSINFHQRKCRLVVSQDVTNKRILEQELKKSNDEFDVIVKSITDGFFIMDENFTILKSNEPLREMAEVAFDTITGKKIFDLFPSIKNEFSHVQYLSAFETGKAVHFENFHKKTGMWLRVAAYPSSNGLSVFFRNITKEKENEIRFIKNYQDLYALINNTEDMIWSIDSGFRFHVFNTSYRENYMKYVHEDLWDGKPVFQKNSLPEHVGRWKHLYEKAMTGKSFSTELEIFIPEMGTKYVAVSFNPIFGPDQHVTGVGCFLHDITLSKIYSQKVEMQNKKLKEISYIISHKLKEPLSSLVEFTTLLNNDMPGHDKLEVVEFIGTSSKKLDHIIKNMVMQTVQVNDPEI